jgi:hypothetical protein
MEMKLTHTLNNNNNNNKILVFFLKWRSEIKSNKITNISGTFLPISTPNIFLSFLLAFQS